MVKKVAAYLGVRMTEETFAKGVGKIVPIVGGVVSGGITLATFRPMSAKLRNYLSGLSLADPSTYEDTAVRKTTGDAIEIEAEVVETVSLQNVEAVVRDGRSA